MKILVAEDSSNINPSVCLWLSHHGYRVILTGDTSSTLTMSRLFAPSLSAIVIVGHIHPQGSVALIESLLKDVALCNTPIIYYAYYGSHTVNIDDKRLQVMLNHGVPDEIHTLLQKFTVKEDVEVEH